MTLQKAIDIFNILQDKYGSSYMTAQEAIDLLNMAGFEYLNRLFPDSQGGLVNFEQDRTTLSSVQPLLWDLTLSGATLTTAAINSALATASGEAGATYFRIVGVGVVSDGETIPAKFMKNNNRWAFERNVFKRPTTTNPYYKLVGSGISMIPSTITSTYLSVIKNPKTLTTSMLSDALEFSDYSVYSIIAIALKLGGIATRDAELIEDARLSGLQISQ